MTRYSKTLGEKKGASRKKLRKKYSRKGKPRKTRLRLRKAVRKRSKRKTKGGGAPTLESALEQLVGTAVKYLFETPSEGQYTICKKTSLTPSDQGISLVTNTGGELSEIPIPESEIKEFIKAQTTGLTGVFKERTLKTNIYQQDKPASLDPGEFCFWGLTDDLLTRDNTNIIQYFYLSFNSFNHDAIWTLRFKKITYVQGSGSTPKKNREGISNLPPGTTTWIEFFVETDEDDYKEINFKNFLYELNFGLVSFGDNPIDVYIPKGDKKTVSQPGVSFGNNAGAALNSSKGAHFHELNEGEFEETKIKEIKYRKGYMYSHTDGRINYTKWNPTEEEKDRLMDPRIQATEVQIKSVNTFFYEEGIVLIQQQYGLQCAVHCIANLLQDPRLFILLPEVDSAGGDTTDINDILTHHLGYQIINNSLHGQKQVTTVEELENISSEPNFIGFIKQIPEHGGHFISFLRRGEHIYKIDSLNPIEGESGGIITKYTLSDGLVEINKDRVTGELQPDNLLLVFKFDNKHIKPILVSKQNSIIDTATAPTVAAADAPIVADAGELHADAADASTFACEKYTVEKLMSTEKIMNEAKIIGAFKPKPDGNQVIIQVDTMIDGIQKPRFDVKYQKGEFKNVDRMKKVVLESPGIAKNDDLPNNGKNFNEAMASIKS